jgi:hypothetical protein
VFRHLRDFWARKVAAIAIPLTLIRVLTPHIIERFDCRRRIHFRIHFSPKKMFL